jgi:FkbM family methyltransferase
MKSLLKRFLLRFGIRVYGPRSIPKGVDLFHDLKRYDFARSIKTVVDVGANIGSFSLEMQHALPGRRIIAFEPAAKTFEELRLNVNKYPNITPNHAALGRETGEALLKVYPTSRFNSLLPASRNEIGADADFERVAVKALDDISVDFAIKSIDLLKTDTEGFDVAVLSGAKNLLARNAIKLILCEVTFHSNDIYKTQFSEVWKLLESSGFDLFGFYSQSRFRERGALDFCDALFVNTAERSD